MNTDNNTGSKRWMVRADRESNGQRIAVYELGPFRFRTWARCVAWLETRRAGAWTQCCTVVDLHARPPGSS
ncbi:hypothetical protein [Pseudorhodoferax sp. Leaf267]|uniref:hypothetical protein n=1 Tax=Pseudorhodoferax sp. Leaf267 TaxID=1736316 RepID=UPI0012E24F9F|nr:hypothetical protein [Pseudorhodoferax sp. Leaf267]